MRLVILLLFVRLNHCILFSWRSLLISSLLSKLLIYIFKDVRSTYLNEWIILSFLKNHILSIKVGKKFISKSNINGFPLFCHHFSLVQIQIFYSDFFIQFFLFLILNLNKTLQYICFHQHSLEFLILNIYYLLLIFHI